LDDEYQYQGRDFSRRMTDSEYLIRQFKGNDIKKQASLRNEPTVMDGRRTGNFGVLQGTFSNNERSSF
jgi:hypothetical protein